MFAILAVCCFTTPLFSGGGDGSEERQEELFQQVFKRFDRIDKKLDDIQEQMLDGFAATELRIQEENAKKELDLWINVHLGILDDDYSAYLNPDHTFFTRPSYEGTFQKSCHQDHYPLNNFKSLYHHSCNGCRNFPQSNQYMLDMFIDLSIYHLLVLPEILYHNYRIHSTSHLLALGVPISAGDCLS